MNHSALDQALQDLAAEPSNAESVRQTVARRSDARRRHRRSAALIGAAAAVVLIVGGIGLVATGQRSAPPVVTHPDWRHEDPVVIPGGSRLIPYLAPPLTSPVTVTAGGPPAGYVARRISDVSALLVSWPNADYNSSGFQGSVGYQIDQRVAFGDLADKTGEALTKPAEATTEQITVNGHPGHFNRTPVGTVENGTMPGIAVGARMWITWQLSDGSYIHVWSVGDDRTALTRLANGIVEEPSTLPSYLTIGVTMPGLTARGTQGIRGLDQRAAGPLDEQIVLCPAGTPSMRDLGTNEGSTCLTAEVAPTSRTSGPAQATDGIDQDGSGRTPGTITQVGGRSVDVIPAARMASIDLGRGYTATVHGPTSMSMSDLTLAATSIRLDPAVPAAPSS